jgi:DNA invertase Pin-like site-specific DNA recombinase
MPYSNKLRRARYYRQRRAAQGATPRDYDPIADRYELQPSQLANLEIRRATIRQAASERRRAIERLMAQGRSVADIVLITGISRAAIYRFTGGCKHWAAIAGRTLCGALVPPAIVADDDEHVNCRHCLKRTRDPILW